MKRSVVSSVVLLFPLLLQSQPADEGDLFHVQIFQDVLSFRPDADVNARDSRAVSSLMIEAFHGHPQAVSFLLELGANVVATDFGRQTAEDYARAAGHDAIAETLRQRREALGEEELEDFTHANFARQVVLVGVLPHIDTPPRENGRTLLMGEVHHGHIHAIEALLRIGADPDLMDSYGKSARDYAEMYAKDKPAIIEALERFSGQTQEHGGH